MNIVEVLLQVALLGSSWVLWLLIALSIVSIAAMIERAVFLRLHRRGGQALEGALRKALEQGSEADVERALRINDSTQAKVLREAFAFREGGPEALSEAIEGELAGARKQLDRSMTLLGTLGNNAPFVGLFGTVLGVIEAFHHLSGGPGDAAMGNVMSGIAEALIATGVGIFVAIPAVVAYNVSQKATSDIESDTVAFGKLISAWLRSGTPRSRVTNSGTSRAVGAPFSTTELAEAE